MRENNENWLNHLKGLLVELIGLGEIYNNTPSYISLLSKLEGILKQENIEFILYRKIIFESISLLREIIK